MSAAENRFVGLLEGCTFEDTDFGYIRSSTFVPTQGGEYTIALRLSDDSKWCDWVVAVPHWECDDSPEFCGSLNPSYGEWLYLTAYRPYRLFINSYNGLKAADILTGTVEMGSNVTAPPVPIPPTPPIIADKLLVIADNTPSVTEKIKLARNTSTGKVVVTDDICDVEHNVDVKLSSKNLLNMDRIYGVLSSGQDQSNPRTDFEFDKFYDDFARTNFYVHEKFDSYTDVSVSNGVLTVVSNTGYYGCALPIKVKPDTTYTVSGEIMGDSPFLAVTYYDINGNYINNVGGGASVRTFTTPSNCTMVAISICSQVKGGTVTATKLQLEYGSTATEYEPYVVNLNSVKVSISGKNLFDKVAWIDYCNTYSPQKAILNDNYLGEECFSFTHNWKSIGIPNFMEGAFEPNTQYTISTEYTYAYEGRDNIKATVCTITYTDGEKVYVETTASNSRYNKFSFTSQAGKTIRGIQFSWVSSTYRVYFKYIQIEEGTTATEYEPYTAYGEYTANADGTVEGVKSIYPIMVISSDSDSALITCKYFTDGSACGQFIELNKAFESAKSLI